MTSITASKPLSSLTNELLDVIFNKCNWDRWFLTKHFWTTFHSYEQKVRRLVHMSSVGQKKNTRLKQLWVPEYDRVCFRIQLKFLIIGRTDHCSMNEPVFPNQKNKQPKMARRDKNCARCERWENVEKRRFVTFGLGKHEQVFFCLCCCCMQNNKPFEHSQISVRW